jgi:hypothetical protein
MSTPVLQHYHSILLPVLFALDNKTRSELAEAITEVDYLIETLCHCELNPIEKQETEFAYWAWWEKIRSKIPN